MVTILPSQAAEIASLWGPALTQGMVDGDMSGFRDLFVSGNDECVDVILQATDGKEVQLTVGDNSDSVTMTWDEFFDVAKKDLDSQNYVKTEALCLGILGDRMMLQTGRINHQGEVYVETFALLTLNEQGKIIMFESFAPIQLDGVIEAAVAVQAGAQ